MVRLKKVERERNEVKNDNSVSGIYKTIYR